MPDAGEAVEKVERRDGRWYEAEEEDGFKAAICNRAVDKRKLPPHARVPLEPLQHALLQRAADKEGGGRGDGATEEDDGECGRKVE